MNAFLAKVAGIQGNRGRDMIAAAVVPFDPSDHVTTNITVIWVVRAVAIYGAAADGSRLSRGSSPTRSPPNGAKSRLLAPFAHTVPFQKAISHGVLAFQKRIR